MYVFAYTLELQDILLTSNNTEVTNTAPTQAEVKYEADSVKIQHNWRKDLFSTRTTKKKQKKMQGEEEADDALCCCCYCCAAAVLFCFVCLPGLLPSAPSPPPPLPSHPIHTYHSGCTTRTTLRVRRPVNLETGNVTQSWCIPHSSHNLFEESTVACNSFCFHRTTFTVTQFSPFLCIFRLFCLRLLINPKS